LVGSLACHAGTRDFCSALAVLVGTVKIKFSAPCNISISLTPSLSKLGRLPSWVAYLLVCVYETMVLSIAGLVTNCRKRLINGFLRRGYTVAGVGVLTA
jgi:hypothetical protein